MRHDDAGGDRHGQHADAGQPGDRDGDAQQLPGRDQFEALAGGTVTLVGAENDQYRHGGAGKRRHRQRPERAGLTSFTETSGWTYSTLQASNGGTVDDSSLASLSNVNLNVAGTGEISRSAA